MPFLFLVWLSVCVYVTLKYKTSLQFSTFYIVRFFILFIYLYGIMTVPMYELTLSATNFSCAFK